MDKHEASEYIEKQLCKEVTMIAESISKNQTISMQELEKLDKLYHALKSKATYEAMVEASEYSESGMSGRRGRGADGRYVSRDSGRNYEDGYEKGFSEGYSEAMNRNQSEAMMHYPMPRRW